jgi:hypothetical protein
MNGAGDGFFRKIRPESASDPLFILLIANAVTILFAMVEGWNLATTLLIYWIQSVIIGFFTVLQILMFPVDGAWGVSPETRMRVGPRSFPLAGPIGIARKLGVAGFFTLHYGIFHLVYLGFILMFAFVPGMLGTGTATGIPNMTDILIVSAFFFANHLYSFLFYRRQEEAAGTTLMDVFTRPYARIIPMHLTIIGGGFLLFLAGGSGVDANRLVVLFFLVLKTLADLWSHVRKHRMSAQDVTSPERI